MKIDSSLLNQRYQGVIAARIYYLSNSIVLIAQSAEVAEYTDCSPAED